jgi:hypothetical protein
MTEKINYFVIMYEIILKINQFIFNYRNNRSHMCDIEINITKKNWF